MLTSQRTVYYNKDVKDLANDLTLGQTLDLTSILLSNPNSNAAVNQMGAKEKRRQARGLEPKENNSLSGKKKSLTTLTSSDKLNEDQSSKDQNLKQEKETKKMTPTTNNDKLKIQKTVFDLKAFDNVLLVKEVEKPKKPESVADALNLLGNDTSKLLDVIYNGLIAVTRDNEYDNMTGFKVVDDEGNVSAEDYNGQSADETKGKLINAAILSLAKMQGYDKSKTPDQKRELKQKAAEFLRSNPAMIASLQG